MDDQRSIWIIVGTRPNFIKVTRFKKVAEALGGPEVRIVHTGQHYDERMADVFFRQFGMEPDHFLGVEGGDPNEQIGRTILGLNGLLSSEGEPDMVLVVGDVNATLAGSLFANKAGLLSGHIESGLRSFDRRMPEEINRIVADDIVDHFFITEESGKQNLLQEGKYEDRMHFVGNTMIDTMVACEPEIEASSVLEELSVKEGRYVLMTMHRPGTVDHREGIESLIRLIRYITQEHRLVFPAHPRTVRRVEEFGLYEDLKGIEGVILTEPLGYFDFQRLIRDCAFIMTDSGGIQEESTYRGKPCLTLRENTERPSTTEIGTNTLVPFEEERIRSLVDAIRDGTYKKGEVPPKWDGQATERVLRTINEFLG